MRAGAGLAREMGHRVTTKSIEEVDRHDLYEWCVQSPERIVSLLRGIHGPRPACRVLGEDFCGTAAISHAWVASDRRARAIAVDVDAAVMDRHGAHPRIEKVCGDLLAPRGRKLGGADVVFVGNFSIGEIHDRGGLVAYMKRSRARLNKGGVFVCDTYGGENAFLQGSLHQVHPLPGMPGVRVDYTWEQRAVDPLTGHVVNAMHFSIRRGRKVVREVRDAFVYSWRLWSVPELRDAMSEAGFGVVECFQHVPEAVDDAGRTYVRRIEQPDELDESFVVCVAGRG